MNFQNSFDPKNSKKKYPSHMFIRKEGFSQKPNLISPPWLFLNKGLLKGEQKDPTSPPPNAQEELDKSALEIIFGDEKEECALENSQLKEIFFNERAHKSLFPSDKDPLTAFKQELSLYEKTMTKEVTVFLPITESLPVWLQLISYRSLVRQQPKPPFIKILSLQPLNPEKKDLLLKYFQNPDHLLETPSREAFENFIAKEAASNNLIFLAKPGVFYEADEVEKKISTLKQLKPQLRDSKIKKELPEISSLLFDPEIDAALKLATQGLEDKSLEELQAFSTLNRILQFISPPESEHPLHSSLATALCGISAKEFNKIWSEIRKEGNMQLMNSNAQNERKIPKITHRLWVTSKTDPKEPPLESLYDYKASVELLPVSQGWTHYFWCLNQSDLPQTTTYLTQHIPSVQIKEIGEIYEGFLAKKIINHLYGEKYYTIASNVIRFNLLHQYGGVFSDIGSALSPVLDSYLQKGFSHIFSQCGLWGHLFEGFITAVPSSTIFYQNLLFLEELDKVPQDILKDSDRVNYGGVGLCSSILMKIMCVKYKSHTEKVLIVPEDSLALFKNRMSSWKGEGKLGNKSIQEAPISSAFLLQAFKNTFDIETALKKNRESETVILKPFKVDLLQPANDSIALAIAFKDEEDLLFENLCWHYNLGFRKFFLMNNLSTDSSLEKVNDFKKLVSKDTQVLVLDDSIVEHMQMQKMTSALKFMESLWPNVVWAFPTDADEFWFPHKPLKDVLNGVSQEVDAIVAPPLYYQSTLLSEDGNAGKGKPFYEVLNFKTPIHLQNPNTLQRWMNKSIIKLPLSKKIAGGNHFLTEDFKAQIPCGNYVSGSSLGIHLREYHVRSEEQFIRKVVNKGRAKKKAYALGLLDEKTLAHYTWKLYEGFLEKGEDYLRNEFKRIITPYEVGAIDPMPIGEVIQALRECQETKVEGGGD